jgi:uncharacterized protein YcgL (UPF0745 family)
MPNWCMNNITVSHPDPSKVQEFADAYNSGQTCGHYLPLPEGEDWYQWQCNNWGTKWDFGKDEYEDPAVVEDNKINVSFNTAWSPPNGLYDELHRQGYILNGSYWEPGLCFCGTIEDGMDLYVEYEDYSEIPDHLWDEYGMSDFFEMTRET